MSKTKFCLRVIKGRKVVAYRYFSTKGKAQAYWDRATEYGFNPATIGMRKSIRKVRRR